MLPIIFGIVFWIFAILFTYLKWKEQPKSILTTLIKMTPAFSAALFILLAGSSLFHILLAAALIFCGLGDVGMEIDILPGLGLFLISHFIFTGNFLVHGAIGASTISIAGFIICIGILILYLYFYFEYVRTAEEAMPGPFLKAAYVYGIMISLTAASALLLGLSGALFGIVPFIGALLFIASDSMIVVKEFHHKFKYDEELTLLTYYAGIFLLALGAVIFVF
jgi:uncharacterized membrane protein YhhN